MNLQSELIKRFQVWQPSPPESVEQSKSHVTLSFHQKEFQFLEGELLYRIEKREKLPSWVSVYCGSETTKKIDYLAPCSPHKFRLKVILKASAVPHIAAKAKEYYGNEQAVIQQVLNIQRDDNFEEKGDFIDEFDDTRKSDIDDVKILQEENDIECSAKASHECGDGNFKTNVDAVNDKLNTPANGDAKVTVTKQYIIIKDIRSESSRRWISSLWSEESWASTDSDGTSATCFCMAVRGGYLKQMQMMLDERPALINIINSTNGFTPLATAVRKGDLSTVRFLLSSGAEVDQRSSTAQTALHLAVLNADCSVAELLIDRGADITVRDRNGLRAEHYAADSSSADMMALVLRRGGELHVTDRNGWTPLFRAVCQGKSSAMVELLVSCGSDVTVVDRAGLSLASAARLVKDGPEHRRDAIIRLVDKQYPHELAVANFLKLTRKITRVHTMFKS